MPRTTKNDMARVIVAALYGMKFLPPAKHHEVARWSRMRAEELRDHHEAAMQILSERDPLRRDATSQPRAARRPTSPALIARRNEVARLNDERFLRMSPAEFAMKDI